MTKNFISFKGSLKKEIEDEMDREEYVEDEEGFRFIGELILSTIRKAKEFLAKKRVLVKVWATKLFCPSRCKHAADLIVYRL